MKQNNEHHHMFDSYPAEDSHTFHPIVLRVFHSIDLNLQLLDDKIDRKETIDLFVNSSFIE
jgi:hypothetical protein